MDSLSDKVFMSTVVNQVCYFIDGQLFEITSIEYTVPWDIEFNLNLRSEVVSSGSVYVFHSTVSPLLPLLQPLLFS